jgi:succinyl-diaminopimelate desuccinylase
MISREKLLSELEGRKEELIRLCCDLIRINTENPPCKTGSICEYVGDFFKKIGVGYKTYEADPGKVNIVGTIQGRTKSSLIFNGHLDVVPAGDLQAWKWEPFGGIVDDGKIWGRGAADMKTKIASAMFVAKLLRENGVVPFGDIILMFTADEETGGTYGAKYLVDQGIIRGGACIIGESAGRDIGVVDKGNIGIKLITRGKSAHAARYFEGDNAIQKLIKLIHGLNELESVDFDLPTSYLEIVDKTLPYYEKRSRKLNIPLEKYKTSLLHVTVCCSLVKGGTKRNVVPDSAEAEFDLRLPPGAQVAKVKEAIEKIVDRSGISNVAIKWMTEMEASHQSVDCDIFRAARKAIYVSGGAKEPLALVKTSFTDARHLRTAGIPTIILGHDGSGGHVPNEYSEIEEVLFTTRVYLLTLFEYFAICEERNCDLHKDVN